MFRMLSKAPGAGEGPAKVVSVSLPEGTVLALRKLAGRRGLSALVDVAVQEYLRNQLTAAYLEEYEQEHGQSPSQGLSGYMDQDRAVLNLIRSALERGADRIVSAVTLIEAQRPGLKRPRREYVLSQLNVKPLTVPCGERVRLVAV